MILFLPPLLFRVRRAGEGEGEGSPQGLRGWMGEVEQWACRHHRAIGITSGLDGSQNSSVYGLDLKAYEGTAVLQHFGSDACAM